MQSLFNLQGVFLMLRFLLGVFVASLLTLYAAGKFVYQWIIFPLECKPEKQHPRPDPIDLRIIDRLIAIDKALEGHLHETESSQWFNMLIHWIITDLFRTGPFFQMRWDRHEDTVQSVRRNKHSGRFIVTNYSSYVLFLNLESFVIIELCKDARFGLGISSSILKWHQDTVQAGSIFSGSIHHQSFKE
jgi:hypothetical protein